MWHLAFLLCPFLLFSASEAPIVIIVSANAEWKIVRELHPQAKMQRSPYGEFFTTTIAGVPAVILQGGWGKVDAAASAQYSIDRWKPRAIFNLGTCGGIAGQIERHEILLASKTVIYDIVEMMGDSAEAIGDYSTSIDLAWLGPKLPHPVRRAALVSGDRDLHAADIPKLRKLYGAIAADWESGAIARVATRNATRVVILRGVSDLVSAAQGEAYGKPHVFEQGTRVVMKKLFAALPDWAALVKN
jgi:adenosylhomocysteine nucleosidase